MVNKEKVIELADFIESQVERMFNMDSSLVATCLTAGCIGGFGAALWPKTANFPDRYFSPYKVGKELGLSKDLAWELFYPTDTDDTGNTYIFDQITRACAVKCLRNLAETGEVVFDLKPAVENRNDD